ncbi:hypothetical protein [Anaerolentibacter hominis]|uniref:hypothetical protein n=1 Tax=Anaerolentibacter hominis TaxID=3079009 RepID=UPI0031B8A43E
MRGKRVILMASLCLILMLSLTACHSSKSFTFQIENGEKIQVKLDTTDGYDLLQESGTITVQKDGEDILNGVFLLPDGYSSYETAITSSSEVDILEAAPEDAPTYYLYQFEGEAGTETTFLFKIEGAETGMIIGSLASREEAEAAFGLLEFEIEK